MRSAPRFALVGALAGFLGGGCGSSPSSPSAAATITIGAAGVSPKQVRIRAINYITFINQDTRPHVIASDPVDVHTQCPALNRVGVIAPGESRETATLSTPGTCGYHDHNDAENANLRGSIVIQ